MGLVAPASYGQDKVPPPVDKLPLPTEVIKPTPPPADTVAATVNGEKILELAVFRGTLRENPKNRDAVRKEVLTYLVDNLLIDQYLRQLKVPVEDKEIQERVDQIKMELKKIGQDFTKQMDELFLTEDDVRKEIAGALRWDKFVVQQGNDKVLRDLFDKNTVMFDGTQVQARHILVATKETPPEKAQAKLAELKKEIEGQVTAHLTKLPAGTDKITMEKERVAMMAKAFSDAATKESSCPSKAQGGDLGWFPRVGAMVEPFSRTAFSLKEFQMSDPIQSDFGYHLILTTGWKAGKEVKFEAARPFVLEVYGERLRDAVLNAYRPRSKIEVLKGS